MKVFLDSIGCRLNQSEIERWASQLRLAGHQLVANPEDSDLIIVNTCTVTAAAAADSRKRTRNAYRRNNRSRILLTGCWSSLEQEAALALPGVTGVIPNDVKDNLVAYIFDLPQEALERLPQERRPIPGSRKRTRAFIKIQDGCDNHCSYCLTTIARGPARSQPVDCVLAEVRAAHAGGAQEVVLSGVQLTAYGREVRSDVNLVTLLKAILSETKIPRVRLSSLEPWGLPEDLFALWEDPRMCRQLHLPLQSGCERTLRRMGRPIRPEGYARLVAEARNAISNLAVTSDIMVGFPGETDEDFLQNMIFVEEMGFAGGHVFVYSPRPGTAAYLMPDRVPLRLARKRSQQMRKLIERSASAFRTRFIGHVMNVLWESHTGQTPGGWCLSGLTDNYLRVDALSEQDLWNRVSRVHLLKEEGDVLLGKIIDPILQAKCSHGPESVQRAPRTHN